ncbi:MULTISPECIES: shikimate kinase [Aphanothece]|uniref:shikimate kinase n=1 Tax=Aphanothece TaxID=1121 RepID=UPI003984820F
MVATEHQGLARRLQGLNLYLVGMMGSGKSAVGRPLAEALGYRFIDADQVLEAAAGRPIPRIFAADGEEGFRELETSVLGQISGWHSLVVATGGGAVTRPQNWGHMHQGVVIWLDAPEPLLLSRLSHDPTPRPLMAAADPAERLAALMATRRPLYAQADLRISQAGGQGPEAVAAMILRDLPSILRERPSAPEDPVLLRDGDGALTHSLN